MSAYKYTTNVGDEVKNVSGDEYEPMDNALKYWKDETNKDTAKCVVSGCTETAKHGAHVRRKGRTKIYIAPFCAGCNNPNNTGLMQVNANIVLVEIPEDDYKNK